MDLLGFRFAPRIRDLTDKRLYIHGDIKHYPTLARLIGGSVNGKHIRAHWDDILHLILWNTVYLGRAIQALRDSGQHIDATLLPHLSPLGWEHINVTGDYS